MQGGIEGDASKIESSVAKNATKIGDRQYMLNDGTMVTFHDKTRRGPSMQINTGQAIYKVRIK